MEKRHIRSFEIEHTLFMLDTEVGNTCLRSTGNHWAIRDTDGSWCVFKDAHFRARLGRMEPEEVAGKLAAFDRAHRDLMASLGIA